jgi:uncharacterized membrane protein YfcA
MSVLLGLMVGLVLGLTGAGGSILAVPLLMWGLDWTLVQAAPVALIAVAAASAFGTAAAWDVTFIRYRAASLMALASLLTAPLGLMAAAVLPHNLLGGLFSVVLLVVATRMWLQSRKAPEETAVVRATVAGDKGHAHGPLCKLNPRTGRIIWTRPCAAAIGLCGALTGFLAGLLGVGGGFVIVPSLRAISEVSIHSAVATSLMAIALISSATVGIAVVMGHELPWLIALPFALGALAGMLAGRKLAPRIAGPRLQMGFAALIATVALGLAARSLQLL